MIEDVSDGRRGSYGRHHGLHRPSVQACVHLAEQVRQIAVLGGAGATLLARHLACALDAGLLGLGPAERAADFVAGAQAVQICPVRWRVLAGEPTMDDLQTATFVITDDPASARQISALRPTLFSRPAPRRGSIGTNVLIVWDGSSRAGLAVRTARPLLRDARHVRILATPGADPAGAAEILEEHGIVARIDAETDFGTFRHAPSRGRRGP